ncbi:signal peptidase I [Paenibacillus cellulositrophicus]|uniref:signal peptidase I n=1 Tax=Paenibacillus cellulositrophicus TaxID=562959 RepID=UPI003F7E0E06
MKVSLVLLLALSLLAGCTNSNSVIEDADTLEKVEIIKDPPANYLKIKFYSDQMSEQYIYDIHGAVVVDTDDKNQFKRGDVVYYRTPEFDHSSNPYLNPPENSIARIIALPGEKVSIKDYQIYINGSKLDTFYGKYPYTSDYSKVDGDMKEVKVPDDCFFIIGDNWWRSIDSTLFGPLKSENLIGKAIGVTK